MKASDPFGRHAWGRAVATLLLTFAAFLAHARGYIDTLLPLLGAAAGVAGYNFVLRLASRSRDLSAWAFGLDILSLTVYLHYSGDIENPLVLAYAVPVVAGAVLVSRRFGYLLALASTSLFLGLLLLTVVDAMPLHLRHHHLDLLHDQDFHQRIDPDLDPRGRDYLVAHTGALLALLFGAAYGFGSLAERLRAENRKMRTLLEILPEGVALLDPDGRILLANAGAERTIGGAAGWRGLDPRFEIAPRLARFAGPLEEHETETEGRVLAHGLARTGPGGPFVWVFRDVTERRRMTAQLIHQSKMADLGLLAAGIAHEIGNPLSSMGAVLEILETKPLAEDVRSRLRLLEDCIARIDRIVKEVTGFARPAPEPRGGVAVEAVVEKALSIARLHERVKRCRIETDLETGGARVRGVEDQLVQVLFNLLLNAADATEGRGPVQVQARRRDGEVRITVRDRGPGLSEEAQRRLFTPFFTTKEPGRGTGLGLFVSEAVVRGQGGRIEARSRPGEGAEFEVVLPVQGG